MQSPIALILVSYLFAVESAMRNQTLPKKAVKNVKLQAVQTSNSQPSMSDAERREFLDAHNNIRAEHGEPPYTWDPKLEEFAKQYFEKERYTDCELKHSTGPYGESIMVGHKPHLVKWNATDAVSRWASEKQYYDRASNACQPGQVCGHYTQIVWRDSVRLGCFRGVCQNGYFFFICSYEPPGNWVGESPFDDHGRQNWSAPSENQTSQANITAPPGAKDVASPEANNVAAPPKANDTAPAPKANNTAPPPEANYTMPPKVNDTAPPETNDTLPPPEANDIMPPEGNDTAPPEANDTAPPPEAYDTAPPTEAYDTAPPPEPYDTGTPEGNDTATPNQY